MVPNDMTARPASPLRSPLLCMASLVVLAMLALAGFRGVTNLSLFYLHHQDQWLLLIGTVLTACCLWRLTPRDTALRGSWRMALVIGALMGLAAFAGHYLILSGYDLSRDEQMATFDAAIFAKGALLAPLPLFWRDHADALNTMFLYPAEQRGAWVSAYLPLNAALRSLVGFFSTPALTGPLMILTGALALWGCTRRIWPDDREASVVAILLYAGSAQILFNGMTAYAMPAHLTFNLCWLWLVLGRRWWMDGMALVLGFIAVGLHQPHMHPLFAAPILFLLLLERRWGRAAFYFVGYAAIGAFWLWWPNAMWAMSQASEVIQKPEGVDYLTRLLAELQKSDRMAFANMAANLLRFAAWQHLLLIPLMLVGFGLARRDRLAGALAAGLILTIGVMAVILPYQGHGFGYRYLHAVTGSAILLAVYGWTVLAGHRASWRPLLLRTTVAGLCLLLPVQAWMAYCFYAPFAQLSERIDASSADYVVVDENGASFSADLVVNPPWLDQRPIRLLSGSIDAALARTLCARRASVAFAGQDSLRRINVYFDQGVPSPRSKMDRSVAKLLATSGCRIETLK